MGSRCSTPSLPFRKARQKREKGPIFPLDCHHLGWIGVSGDERGKACFDEEQRRENFVGHHTSTTTAKRPSCWKYGEPCWVRTSDPLTESASYSHRQGPQQRPCVRFALQGTSTSLKVAHQPSQTRMRPHTGRGGTGDGPSRADRHRSLLRLTLQVAMRTESHTRRSAAKLRIVRLASECGGRAVEDRKEPAERIGRHAKAHGHPLQTTRAYGAPAKD